MNITIPTSLLFISIIYSLIGSTYKSDVHSDPFGAGYYTVFLGIILFILSLILLVKNIIAKKIIVNISPQEILFDKNSLKISILMIIYAISIKYIGFIVCTLSFFCIFLHLFKIDHISYLIYSAIISVTLYIIFVFLLNTPLSDGIIFPETAIYRYYMPWN